MTDFKVAIWMEQWSQDDHDAYEAAWLKATAADPDRDSGVCSRTWLALVLAASTDSDTGQWARDVLGDMQRRGALESWKDATVKPVVVRKGRTLTVAAAEKRRDSSGLRDVYVQTELFDMSQLAERLLELVNQAIAAGASDTCTPRQAAVLLKIDLADWCAA